MKKPADNHGSVTVKVHAKEFVIPPIRDALVVGKTSPIGCVALQKALALLHGKPLMDPGEVIHLDIEVEVFLEHQV